jgi:hypothetical protein
MKLNKMITPIVIALVLGVIAVLSIWTQQPWLAPSIGSAVFAQVLNPDQPSAKPYSIGVGQLLGGVAGFAGVFIAAAATTPQFMGGHELVAARAIAVAVAVLLAAALQLLAKATNPAGGATAVVIAIGAETATLAGAFHLAVGILLVTALGEAARQAVLRARAADARSEQPAP